MNKKLLIVESPAKAKVIGKYLGEEYVVKSSVGHIRDLPKTNNAIAIRNDAENKWTFIPTYEISDGKEKVVKDLQKAVKSADEIYLASDPDREGEAIAWHLKEVLKDDADGKPFRRVTYNEVTKSAVLKAVAEPRDIDMPRVDAQQARRILDRLVGYKVSPLLWKNIHINNAKLLSAGRVQSVALRLLVERQREIDDFKPVTYFLLGVEAKKRDAKGEKFAAKLARFDGEKPDIKEKSIADNIILDLSHADLKVIDIKTQPKVRHTLPPFTTSTLQQAASSVLGYGPGKTMKIAQKLYEHGFITYMRTDSVNISEQARAAAKEFIVSRYGEKFYPEKPNFFKSKADAQGAHEAIRPTDVALSPDDVKLEATDLKLYALIWRRFMASQMSDAHTTLKTVTLEPVKGGLKHQYLFTVSATDIDFEGFLKVMKLSVKAKKSGDDEEGEDTDEVDKLPPLTVGEELDVNKWLCDEKQTKGPSHYSEASLIKALEENGVGRPSTYAQTIETLRLRDYSTTEKKKLIPTERGILVCDYLTKNLDSLFNVGYTAEMEAELDQIEEKGEPMNEMLSRFYQKFTASLKACGDLVVPPDKSKFAICFDLLAQVKEWKKPVKDGKRVYDDKKFFESVKAQSDAGRALSDRQLASLVRLVSMYSSQIADAETKLKDAGLIGNIMTRGDRADPELVKFAFDAMDRIGGMLDNPFLKSLRDQYDHNHPLSSKQFSILAKAVGDSSTLLADGNDIREKLLPYVPGGFRQLATNPEIPKIFDALRKVKKWREPTQRGKTTFNDQEFVASLEAQYGRRHSLSDKQIMALKRMMKVYGVEA